MAAARCRICSRQLKNPKCILAGIGPTCAARVGVAYESKPRLKAIRAQRLRKHRRVQEVTLTPLPFDLEAEEALA